MQILRVCLALSLLVANAACGSLGEYAEKGTSTPASQVSRTEELGVHSSPESSFGETPLAMPEGEVEAVIPEGASESRMGGSQYGIQTDEIQAQEDECRWEITFEDQFSGDSLDSSRWDTGYKAGDKEAQYYVEDAFELEYSVLRIRAEERQVGDREHASGIITTQGKFDQQYGRFEIRAKVPAGQGLWPAFWMMPASGDWPPEIDVFEILGHDIHRVFMSNRWKDDSGEFVSETRGFYGPDFSQGFHVFEIEWEPEQIIWRVDGVERSRQTVGVPHEPMFLLVNLAVGGEWPGYPDETTPFPSYLEVDYVRAYDWSCPFANVDKIDEDGVQTD